MRLELKPYSMLSRFPKRKKRCRAGIIKAPRKISIKKFKLSEPGPGEIRIKLEGCGLCASNIPVWEGRSWFEYPQAPGAPGHEGWGIVDAIGPEVNGFSLRQRVTGLSYHAFATYDIAKQENLVVLPDFLDEKPFPGEPLGCAMNIFNRSDIREKQTVAVVGCGFLGLLLIQLLKSKDCRVIAISRRNSSLDFAKKNGADFCIEMKDHHQIIEEVKRITNGGFCDRSIECTGVEWPLNLAIELTATRGKLIVAGYHQDGMRSVNMQLLNWRGIDMINAHERDPAAYVDGIKKAIKAIQKGELYPFELFTHQFELKNLDRALNTLTARPEGFIKGYITYGND